MNVNITLNEIKNSTAQLNTSLSAVKRNVEQSLNDPMCSVHSVSATCNDIRRSLSQLDDNVNLDQVRRVTLPWGGVPGAWGQLGRANMWVHLSSMGAWVSVSLLTYTP